MGEGRTGSMNYRRAPADVYDDGDALRIWAALALEAGRRGPVKKKKKS
jgi:DNA transformation protein